MGVNMDPAPLLTDRAAYISYLEVRAARVRVPRARLEAARSPRV